MTSNVTGIGPADPLPAGGIDPAILAELTRALLPYLGPYSITTVKRASRATSDAQEAARMVAQQIEDAGKREAFLKSAKRILANVRPAAVSPTAPHGGNPAAVTSHQKTGGRPATPITPELMQRGEAALAPIIGPLANVLVARYARAAENSRDFFERLASHLRTPEERESFFAHIRASGSTASAR